MLGFLEKHFFRQKFLATIVSVMLPLAAAIPSSADAADKLTMRLEWSPFVMHLPLHLAVEKGWFKAADLDVYLEDGNGTITAVQLVGNGKFDIGHAAISAMAIGASKGLPLTSLALYLEKSSLGVVYGKELGIKTPKDLIGKKLVYTPASFETPFIEPFFRMNGIPQTQLNLVGVEASAKVTSYMTGAGDGFIGAVPSDKPFAETKRPSDSLLFADYGMNLPNFGIIANTDTLKQKGPAIKRFVSVVSAAWAYILAGNEKEAVEAMMKQRPNSPKGVAGFLLEYEQHIPFLKVAGSTTYPGVQTREDWVKALRIMEEAKVVATGTSPDKYFTNDYIDVAYGKKIVGLK